MRLDINQLNEVSFKWERDEYERQLSMKKNVQSGGYPAAISGMLKRAHFCVASRRRVGFLLRALILGTVVHGATLGLAAADDQVGRAANASIPPVVAVGSHWKDGLKFESNYQRNWYNVFWTGKCDSLPFFDRLLCLKGSTAWTDVTKMVMDKTEPEARDKIRIRMLELGRKIGHEWARHNEDRRIDNDDLIRWSSWLKKSDDVNGTVDRLAKDAEKLLSRTKQAKESEDLMNQ